MHGTRDPRVYTFKRDPYTRQKRPICMSKEIHEYVKKDTCVRQQKTKDIIQIKETQIHVERDQ